MDETPLTDKPQHRKKTYIIITITVGFLALIGIIAAVLLLFTKPQQSETSVVQEGPKSFIIRPGSEAVSYAGSKLYDACNLVSFDTVRANITNYQTLLDSIRTDQRPAQPLVINHNYIDRDILTVLEKDGQERVPGTVIGGGNEGISRFTSTFDSSCWYGQGEGISTGAGTTFVKTYVIQKPTPISGELLAYVNSLTPRQVQKGVRLYSEEKRDAANFATIIAMNDAKDAIAVFKTASSKMADSAVADVVAALSEPPKGPLSVVYPEPWTGLPDPCELLTADDFERFTGKQASALANDAIFLTDVGDGQLQRSCQRLEVERLNAGEISESKVAVRAAKNIQEAENYVAGIKANEQDAISIQALPGGIEGADEAYVRVEGTTQQKYELEMRIGKLFITVNVKTDAGQDVSVERYSERMQPIAKEILTRLR